MVNLDAIKKDMTLSDKAYEIIKEGIISNKLKPGEILAEEILAEQLQISRTPIKAALRKLVYEQIAEINYKNNVVVSGVTEKDVKEIAVVRKSLESLGILLLKDNHFDENKLDTLRKISKSQMETTKVNDYEGFIERDYEFHTKITEYFNNSFLRDMITKSNFITKRFLILSGTISKYTLVAIEEHEEILKQLEDGEFELASKAMEHHIENVNKRMLIH